MKYTKIAIVLIALSFITSSIVIAETDYYDYIDDLQNNNSTLKILDLNIANMELDVYKANLNAKSMESTLKDLNDLPFSVSNSTLVNLGYVSEVVPKQLEYGLYSLTSNRELTEKTLKSTSRMMAMGIINNDNIYNLNKSKHVYFSTEYDNAKSKFELGLISESELLLAEIKALEAKTNFDKSIRDLENSYLSFNSFLGYDLSSRETIRKETQVTHNIREPEYYIDLALNYRFEFLDLQEQINLQDTIIDFYDYGDNLAYYSNTRAFRSAQIEKEKLELEIRVAREIIKEEILNAVGEINVLDAQIQQLESTLDIQKNTYNDLLLQVEQGYITESTVKELEFAINSIENNLDVMYYSYNTKRYDLFNASVSGPAYGGGM